MQVAIIDYNAGNIFSVHYAMKRLGIDALVTSDKELIAKADKVIFPGQGEANNTMRYLRETGMDKLILDLKQPVLGICIGMQLMCRHSEEGNTDCLSIFDANVKKFVPRRHEDKVPHMGWNSLNNAKGTLFKGITEGEFIYFVHSYYVELNAHTSATSEHIQPFSVALEKDNFYATQFHPEKSGLAGEKILSNFLDI